MQVVSDKLASVQSTMATNSQHVQDLRTMFMDIVSLLEAAAVFKKANAKGEKDPTPLRDESKGKGIVIDEPLKKIMPHIEESSSVPKIPSLKSFVILEGQLTNEDVMDQVKEMKRLADIKAKKENNEKSLKKILNPAAIKAKALGIPLPYRISTFGVSINDKKRKRNSKILKEVFVKKYVVVDGMHKNLVRPLGVEGEKGRVIREPESGIFYYNGNFDLVFQRKEEFYLATTAQLIRLQDASQRGTSEVEEMFKKIELTIEARNDVNRARKIVQDNLDGLGQDM
nr:hypothetical protein [Tanacetum cinerariifolium]